MTLVVSESTSSARSIEKRADAMYAKQLHAGYRRVDCLFAFLLVVEWAGAIAFALWISPLTWAGESVSVHAHVWAAIILGGVIVSLPMVLAAIWPSATITRHAVAIGQMLMSALLIHLSGGRI